MYYQKLQQTSKDNPSKAATPMSNPDKEASLP